MKTQCAAATGLLAVLLQSPAMADPPPVPVFPEVFCFRITDIEDVKSDPTGKTFKFEFEVLNWAKRPAYGVSMALTTETDVDFSGAGTDPFGRKLSAPLDEQPPPGNMPMRTLYAPGGNTWSVTVDTPTAVQWQGINPGDPVIQNFALNPGNPPPWLIPGNLETIDNGFNVMDGFTFTVDDWDPGEVLSFDWFLLDAMGAPFPVTGVDRDDYGFGVVNIARVDGVNEPGPFFVGNSGFSRSLKEFAPFDSTDPNGPLVNVVPDPATFSSEFGGGITAAFLNQADANRLGNPPITTTPVPEASTYAASAVLMALIAGSVLRNRRTVASA
jgi:hypothetical protein